jgi:hypothetical protein
MWCSQCQQDVPAVAEAGGTGRVVCARCQRSFTAAQPAHTTTVCDHGIPLDEFAANATVDDSATTDPVAALSDWQTEQRFRHIARTLRTGARESQLPSHTAAAGYYRFDPPQNLLVDTEPIAVRSTAVRNPSSASHYLPNRRSSGGQVLAWLIVICGFISFSCGVGLVSWSLAEELPFYWDVGTLMALVGEGLLVYGLLLVLSRLWRSSRHANQKLHEIQWQLGEVQRTAQTIVGMKNGNAPAFYAELARGASPQMLLSSLRGQLEQLSARVNGNGH